MNLKKKALTDILEVAGKKAVKSNAPINAAMDAQKNAPQQLLSSLGEAANLMSAPQRIAMQKLAESVGAKGNAESSEESAFNIVDKVARAAGVPEDSTVGNAGKALTVALLEMYADPTIVGGKIKPIAKAVSKGAKVAQSSMKAASGLIKPQTGKVVSGAESYIGKTLAEQKLASDARAAAGTYLPEIKIDKTDSNTFYKAVEAARGSSDMHRINITAYKPEEYKKMKTYLSPDGKSGYAIKTRPDGKQEIVSLFTTERGRGEQLIADATINKGGEVLDAYDINKKLPNLYGKLFDEQNRLKFDSKYAPEGFDAAKFGSPDVVEMKRNPKKILDYMNEQKAAQTQSGTEKSWLKVPSSE